MPQQQLNVRRRRQKAKRRSVVVRHCPDSASQDVFDPVSEQQSIEDLYVRLKELQKNLRFYEIQEVHFITGGSLICF